MSDSHRLLIISPVRNESAHIEKVIDSVVAQTRKPDLWLLADDGSDDDTLAILRRREQEAAFMRVLEVPQLRAVGNDRLAMALEARAFNFALGHVDLGDFTHLGKLDGDIELPPDYFECVLRRMEEDPDLGIAGGSIAELSPRGVWKQTSAPTYHVHGALKLYRRDCFEAIGRIQERPAWDMIDEAYARMRGYRTERALDLEARHHRPSGSADGALRGRMRNGQFAYVARYSLPWVLARSAKVGLRARPRIISGLALTWGYLWSAIRRVERVDDDDFQRLVRAEHRARVRRALRVGRAGSQS